MNWRGLVLIVILGVCTGLVSGFFENPPEASIIGHRYYGYPFAWRITKTLSPQEYVYFELFVDCLIWIAIVSVIAVFAWGSSKWMSRKNARIFK